MTFIKYLYNNLHLCLSMKQVLDYNIKLTIWTMICLTMYCLWSVYFNVCGLDKEHNIAIYYNNKINDDDDKDNKNKKNTENTENTDKKLYYMYMYVHNTHLLKLVHIKI